MLRLLRVSLLVLAVACFGNAGAQGPVIQNTMARDTVAVGAAFSDISMKRNGDLMTVGMDINLAGTPMKGDRVIVYTPVILNGSDSLMLNPVGLYGHIRWIQYLRNNGKPAGGSNEISYIYKERPATVGYSQSVPYAEWMNGAQLVLLRRDYGCCHSLLDDKEVDLARWSESVFQPALKFLPPPATAAKAEKVYTLEGSAFIDFPVDQTVIYPDYRDNTRWLDTIRSTIDVVRNNPDATINTVWLKGFASPESPYAHNTDLARGRTAALKKYIQNLYHFEGVDILTEYEPEDWEGLRKAVDNSNLAHRTEILALIDSDMEPDAKEDRIKKLYPDDYRFMLQTFYPPLRHTNYRVSYTVRHFNDPQEILQVMRTRPGNLSLDEFYVAASVLAPGSDDYNDVFETAARMFPADASTNLNAANVAIQRNDYVSAQKYLTRAGNSPEADYARAILHIFLGDYKVAGEYLDKAIEGGVKVAPNDLQKLRDVIGSAPED